MRPLVSIALTALLGAHNAVAAFDFKVTAPEFTVAVPALPNFSVGENVANARGGSRQFLGGNATFTVEIELSAATKTISSRECAGAILRTLVAKPGMPARDSIYRAPLTESTFLVIYILGEKQDKTLHAHLLSSVGGTHCVEAHFRRLALGGEDVDEWRKVFLGSRIE